MASCSCIAESVDAQTPLKVSFVKLYQWPEADAEFVRLISLSKKTESSGSLAETPIVIHESYACRQRFVRSYNFAKKETLAQKTKKWLKEKKLMKNNSKTGSAKGSSDFLGAVSKFLFPCAARVDDKE